MKGWKILKKLAPQNRIFADFFFENMLNREIFLGAKPENKMFWLRGVPNHQGINWEEGIWGRGLTQGEVSGPNIPKTPYKAPDCLRCFLRLPKNCVFGDKLTKIEFHGPPWVSGAPQMQHRHNSILLGGGSGLEKGCWLLSCRQPVASCHPPGTLQFRNALISAAIILQQVLIHHTTWEVHH